MVHLIYPSILVFLFFLVTYMVIPMWELTGEIKVSCRSHSNPLLFEVLMTDATMLGIVIY